MKSVSQQYREKRQRDKEAKATCDAAVSRAADEYKTTTAAARKALNSKTRRAREIIKKAGDEYRAVEGPASSKQFAAMKHADNLEKFAYDLPASDPNREAAIEQAKQKANTIRNEAQLRYAKVVDPARAKLDPVLAKWQPIIDECQAEFDKIDVPAKNKCWDAQQHAQKVYLEIIHAS